MIILDADAMRIWNILRFRMKTENVNHRKHSKFSDIQFDYFVQSLKQILKDCVKEISLSDTQVY